MSTKIGENNTEVSLSLAEGKQSLFASPYALAFEYSHAIAILNVLHTAFYFFRYKKIINFPFFSDHTQQNPKQMKQWYRLQGRKK
jgi:hypothetical protein